MGLDTVELVLRVEETFDVILPDDECGNVKTVGDLYRLILGKLSLSYEGSDIAESSHVGCDRSMRHFPAISPWTTADVWMTLKGLILDQLQVRPSKVHEGATFMDDLGCD